MPMPIELEGLLQQNPWLGNRHDFRDGCGSQYGQGLRWDFPNADVQGHTSDCNFCVMISMTQMCGLSGCSD
jgi:hypothetical protein